MLFMLVVSSTYIIYVFLFFVSGDYDANFCKQTQVLNSIGNGEIRLTRCKKSCLCGSHLSITSNLKITYICNKGVKFAKFKLKNLPNFEYYSEGLISHVAFWTSWRFICNV